jgi:hypothetical protein
MDNYFDGNLSIYKNSTSFYGVRLMFEEEFENEVSKMAIVKEKSLKIHGAFIDSNFEVFIGDDSSTKKILKKYPVRDGINDYPGIELKKVINFKELEETIKTDA